WKERFPTKSFAGITNLLPRSGPSVHLSRLSSGVWGVPVLPGVTFAERGWERAAHRRWTTLLMALWAVKRILGRECSLFHEVMTPHFNRYRYTPRVAPPSTVTVIPVRNDARLDARKHTRSATSPGSAMRPSGIDAFCSFV